MMKSIPLIHALPPPTHTDTHAYAPTQKELGCGLATPQAYCILNLMTPPLCPAVPRGQHSQTQNVILFSFIILYYIFCLGLSFQFMYVCMYMLYMLYILDYSLLYDICCLDKCKKPIRNVNWRWREWRKLKKWRMFKYKKYNFEIKTFHMIPLMLL